MHDSTDIHRNNTVGMQYNTNIVRSPARRPPSLLQRVPPPGLITSLHTPVHPLITSLHTPVHLLITLSCSKCVDYLCTSAPSLCLPRLLLPALTCAWLYHCVCNLTDYIRFRALGTPALRCRLGCPVLDYCFVFACWLLI